MHWIENNQIFIYFGNLNILLEQKLKILWFYNNDGIQHFKSKAS